MKNTPQKKSVARDITMAMDNSHCDKTHGSARILEGVTVVPQP